jgi:perosamine synthetase
MTPFIPYGRQHIEQVDIDAVVEALRSPWLTTGPRVSQFEQAFAATCDATEAVAVSSGTAALHAAMHALGIGPGDEVIVPAITFVATANAVVFQGGTPVFADVEADTLLVDPAAIQDRVTSRTRAIVTVDYGGQPADYDAIGAIARHHGLAVVADACHAPGATFKNRRIGSIADLSTFSFHPVKHLTTCEGGMITTPNRDHAERMRRFRNHGIDSDHRTRAAAGSFAYDMVELGYNYRLADVQCALGIAQLGRLPAWIAARRAWAAFYDQAFAGMDHVTPLATRADRTNVYHLYVIKLELELLQIDRSEAFLFLRERGIGANVHYAPVYLHSFYRDRFGCRPGLCPVAENIYERILTLPIFPSMTRAEADRVVTAVDALRLLS